MNISNNVHGLRGCGVYLSDKNMFGTRTCLGQEHVWDKKTTNNFGKTKQIYRRPKITKYRS